MLTVDDEWLRSQDEQQKANAAPESVRRLIAVAIGWFVAAVVAAVLFAAVTAAIYSLYRVKQIPELHRFYGAMAMLGFSITLLVAALIRGRVVGHGRIGVGLANERMSRISIVALMAVAVAGYAMWVSQSGIDTRSDLIARLYGLSPWLTIFSAVFVILLAGLLVPLSEELFFRGWLWTGLQSHWDTLPIAAFTSAMWLLPHAFEHGILNLVFLVPIAVALAIARHLGKSVRAPLFLHVIYNNGILISPLVLALRSA